VNLTGLAGLRGEDRLVGDPGSGCSSNQYKQFNTAAVAGPTYGSVGMSRALPPRRLSRITRSTSRWPGIFAWAAPVISNSASTPFNVFNAVIINDRNRTSSNRSPTESDDRQLAVPARRLARSARLTPRNAGFGAATGAQPLRNLQLQIRFMF